MKTVVIQRFTCSSEMSTLQQGDIQRELNGTRLMVDAGIASRFCIFCCFFAVLSFVPRNLFRVWGAQFFFLCFSVFCGLSFFVCFFRCLMHAP